ncbi:MAG: hypothetical protein NWE88_03930 [Candidatus Bathyarchaeota archaeon]|nr:hypothetical protein [Candidatus Bathyarchaeota archaeon]
MSEIRFEMKPVQDKRKKLSGKKSIYDPIIDQFLESGNDLVEVRVEDRLPGYVVGQLQKRIDIRELEIEVSGAQGFVYLEKKPAELV